MQRSLFAPALVLLGSAAVVGTAVASQYLGGLEPCVLCYYQRYPWYAVIALMLAALVLGGRARAALLGLAALLFAAGAVMGAYHVGVEHRLFAGPASCGSVTIDAGSIEALRAQLIGKPVVRCDQPAWSLFGISMAGYNLVASLAMAALAARLARREWQARGWKSAA
ncbi:MAG: disulfide bond formation protein B [Alphaproteobacteria bacterium]|nr:disulfide bond formation protein B [Alphaproteobacteria bacterium]